jgi:hypothetical protein
LLDKDVQKWKAENEKIWDDEWRKFISQVSPYVHLPEKWKS